MPGSGLALFQGTLDMLLLRALVFGPRHGYGLAKWIRDTTDDDLQVEEGALYTALHRMERRGWLASEWGRTPTKRRAKFYSLTAEGRRRVSADTRTWQRYVEAVVKVIQATEAQVPA